MAAHYAALSLEEPSASVRRLELRRDFGVGSLFLVIGTRNSHSQHSILYVQNRSAAVAPDDVSVRISLGNR